MKFTPTPLAGAYILEPEPIADVRGYFAEAWTKKSFEAQGLNGDFVQGNLSYNKKAGTVRGMHAQHAPFEEEKLVRCIEGAIYDVIVDVRPDSPTYLQWFGVELSVENLKMLYVPKNFLHGFQTLVDNSIVQYQVTQYFSPQAAYGARYDDPAFNIQWPEVQGERILSEKDLNCPPFQVIQTAARS